MYSTLGWFDDPIPAAVLRWPEADLVDVVLHEQVHETIFVADEPDYNESLASFIAGHATLAFFEDEPRLRQRAADLYADRAQFAALMEALYRELSELYAEVDGPDEARTRRQVVFGRYRRERFAEVEWKTQRYASFPNVRLSNSYLLARRTYQTGGACFEAELADQGGDLRAFIRAHREAPGHPSCAEATR